MEGVSPEMDQWIHLNITLFSSPILSMLKLQYVDNKGQILRVPFSYAVKGWNPLVRAKQGHCLRHLLFVAFCAFVFLRIAYYYFCTLA